MLETAQKELAWPSEAQVFRPEGGGPNYLINLATRKLRPSLEVLSGGSGARVGLIFRDPLSEDTEAPLAVVIHFQDSVPNKTLEEAQRLAWNLSLSPLLITVEPAIIRAWTCCEPPIKKGSREIPDAAYERSTFQTLSDQISHSLHWMSLLSGKLQQQYESRFSRSGCADQLLLQNLRCVRKSLLAENLPVDIVHSLIARVIFIQFLFHRRDSKGKAALNSNVLEQLCAEGVLSQTHSNLSSILREYHDAYRFFGWLDQVFNGDLFPDTSSNEHSDRSSSNYEKRWVNAVHLKLLADFIDGTLRFDRGQFSLWPYYSFDAIPLDFISSVYQVFVRRGSETRTVVYTPAHVVDYMLDTALPWNDREWNLKVFDPACGSGIFLVKAYERLIHRWKLNHGPSTEITAKVLRQLLENNIFGNDKDSEAVRVASFSLYLAMCDEIDPKYYWERVKFPRLRGNTLTELDFFDDSLDASLAEHTGYAKYDVIIGNAPWGRNTVSQKAKLWASSKRVPITYGNIGPLFLERSTEFLSHNGSIVMLQPTLQLLMSRFGSSMEFRQRLFSGFNVKTIVNMSALRFGLFSAAISPACIVVMSNRPPDTSPIKYIVPKPLRTADDGYRLHVDHYDEHEVYRQEALADTAIWSALMWGNRRDYDFLRRMQGRNSIQRLKESNQLIVREGVIRSDRKRRQEQIVGRRFLSSMPEKLTFSAETRDFPKNDDPYTHSRDSTSLDAFQLPQVVIRQALRSKSRRFQAISLRGEPNQPGVLCSQSFVSVHISPDASKYVDPICLAYNSAFAVYYLLLSSGRLATYRPESNVEDLLSLPLPSPDKVSLVKVDSYEELDERAAGAYEMSDLEKLLVDDLINVTFADYIGDSRSPGRRPTSRGDEFDLKRYCDAFRRVLRAGFGSEKNISATIFQEPVGQEVPSRLVAIHLDGTRTSKTAIESIETKKLLKLLGETVQSSQLAEDAQSCAAIYTRIVRVYDFLEFGENKVPSVIIVKPDRVRYWTASMAVRDADEVAVDIVSWLGSKSINTSPAGNE